MIVDLETRQPLDLASSLGIPSDNRIDKANAGVPTYLNELNELKPSALNAEGTQPPLPQRSYQKDEAEGLTESEISSSITAPALSAEEETRKANRDQHFQGEVGKWEPKQLKPRHREMMRRILEGATYIEISEEMGISAQSVMLVASSVIFKEELSKLESELNLNVIRRAEDLSNEALDKLKMLMRKARSEVLQASCARDVLGIAGYSKIEKKQIAVVSGEDVIRELNRRRREASELGLNGDSRPDLGRSDVQEVSFQSLQE